MRIFWRLAGVVPCGTWWACRAASLGEFRRVWVLLCGLPNAAGRVETAAMRAQPLDILPRPPMAGEFVPAHYFRRLAPADVACPGRPLEVDLGCGDGKFLLDMARHHPERDFLGVERLLGRVRKVCRKITREGLANARVLRLESGYVAEWLLPVGAVSRIHLLCPDPWPKVRHHRRRLVQDRFLAAVDRALVPGGEFLFMTDHEEYYQWGIEKARAYGRFEIHPWEEDSFFHPKTDFQIQWESEGKRMWRLRCRKPVTGG